ncbi:MAG: MmgE/PrpD family protein, partial [Chloroflexi bacterium]|nr:MmgE/PrpD family protein [Chloroflexota bacterium]
MSGATERIAEFIVHTPSKDIPKDAMDVARDATLDCVGVILAASREPIGRIVTDYVRGLGAAPRSGVFGGGFKSSPQDAAFANGVMGHAMDYDDMHTGCAGHPSVALVPAILALGEALYASGEEVLAAYTIGFEVIYRVGQEVGLKFLGNGYHPTGVWAPVGAAAAAARLLKLDPLKTRRALGIAASEAGGIVGNFGTMTKPFHAGNGAR